MIPALPSANVVLATTDFSQRSDSAVPYAYAVAEAWGTVHLLHVIEIPALPNPMYAHYGPTPPSPAEREIALGDSRARLRGLVPEAARKREVATLVHVVEAQAPDIARAIRSKAEEIGADLVCMASHGRRGLARVLMGSVAEEVLRSIGLPVLVVRPPAHALVHEAEER